MELEPISCPFCGGTKLKVESKHHGHHYYEGTHSATVRCNRCHARGPTASCKVEKGKYHADEETKQKAIELWNERAIAEDTIKYLESQVRESDGSWVNLALSIKRALAEHEEKYGVK